MVRRKGNQGGAYLFFKKIRILSGEGASTRLISSILEVRSNRYRWRCWSNDFAAATSTTRDYEGVALFDGKDNYYTTTVATIYNTTVASATNTKVSIASNNTTMTDVATGGDGKFDMERMKMMSSVFHLAVMMVMLMMTDCAFYLTIGCFLSLGKLFSDEDNKLCFSFVGDNFCIFGNKRALVFI